jgi:hypothetical protein
MIGEKEKTGIKRIKKERKERKMKNRTLRTRRRKNGSKNRKREIKTNQKCHSLYCSVTKHRYEVKLGSSKFINFNRMS